MLWTEKMFGVKKPIIAMLHIDPLPGDPLYKSENDMDKVVEHAREDLHALQDGGVDGIIFSNEFSLPYQRNMDMVTADDRQHTLHVCRNKIYTRKNIYSAENSLMRCSSLNRQISNVLFFSATIYPSSPCTTTLFSCVV